MTLARADARFLLPRAIGSAVIVSGAAGWEQALAGAGVEVGGVERPDLAVARARRARAAIATGAGMVVLEGYARRAARTLRRAGLTVSRYQAIPSLERTQLLLPLARGPVRDYAVGRHRSARHAAVRRHVTVGLRETGPPRFLNAAAKLGVDAAGGWFLTLGAYHARSRGAFQVFPPGGRAPAWVVKFGRLPEARERFDKEERGFKIAERVGAADAGRAPRLIGRLEVDGLPASVETAAVGERLASFLAGRGGRAAKLAMIDSIAEWVLTIAATPPRERPPEAELRYLERDVLPHWRDLGASSDLAASVARVPGASVHGDLYVDNVIVRPGGGFMAVDWEDAQPDGLALSDLLDFLLGALFALQRTGMDDATFKARLLRGESDLSEVLFSWMRRAAQTLDLEPGAVAALVTLRILDVASSWRRYEAVGGRPAAGELPQERLARIWLSDPSLGPTWDRWRG